MFALPGIALLILFILARPQELFPLLQRVPLLHIGTALAVLGFVVDVRLGRLQLAATNSLPWAIAFFAWAALSTAINTPAALPSLALEMTSLFVLYSVLAHGVQRLRSLQLIAGVTAATCTFIALVCVHQGLSERQCVGGQAVVGDVEGTPDGRTCERHEECLGPEAEPDLEYRCEHVGLFDGYSIEDRVRYVGELHDPNEVALAVSAGGIALLIGFALRGSAAARLALGLGVLLLFAAIVLTRSRGGLIAAMLVPGVYVVRRFGLAALAPAALVAVPVFLLAGRSGSSAEESTTLRYEAWRAGLDMFEHSPIWGVGMRAFPDHHDMTAHNSYVLALAELGLVGMFLFVALLYLCVKTLYVGMRELGGIPGTATPRLWGMSLISAVVGIVFQINTLSMAYHSVLWLVVGLVGAWYSAVRYHAPGLRIALRWTDAAIVGALTAGYAFAALPLWLAYKGLL